MKKIRTAQGGILFLEDEDYMPKLLAYLRETAGHDAADLVEGLMEEEREHYREAIGHAEKGRMDMLNRIAVLEKTLNDEREEHTEEISELEEELTRVAGLKDEAVAFNRALVELVENPEKLFPEVGASVWREIDGKKQIGTITEVSLKKDYRTGKTEFAIIARFGYGNGARYRLYNIGKTVHLCAEEAEG